MITFKAKTADGEIINSALSSFFFPAGEAHTKFEDRRTLEPTEIAIIQGDIYESIHDDLFQLGMWNDYIIRHDGGLDPETRRILIMPYAPGARADRGMPFGAQIYAHFISKLYLDKVILFDTHSPVWAEQLRHFDRLTEIVEVPSSELFDQLYVKTSVDNKYRGIIAPDAGAADRAEKVAKVFGVPVFQASKKRDFETGKLSGFTIDPLPEGHYLIVDDICDGGGTFIGLGKTIFNQDDPIQLDLYVSHGVFSKDALFNLPEVFDTVITTNSFGPKRDFYDDAYPDQFRRLDVIRLLLDKI